MRKHDLDISFASFNLFNLQLPGRRWRGDTPYSRREYEDKIAWSADRIREMDADVIAFQELWSAQCLKDIFAKDGLDPDHQLVFIRDEWYDIAVAIAVRPPWEVCGTKVHKAFPDSFLLKKRGGGSRNPGAENEDDDIEVNIDRFSRSILQVTLAHKDHPDAARIEFFAVHLKSKLPTRLDREERDNEAVRAHAAPLGAAISTIRRTAESAALRIILNDVMKATDMPVVVAGDCNDAPNSNTLAILSEQPGFRLMEESRAGGRSDKGLYLAGSLQQLRSFRDVNYTHIYKGEHDSLDHVMVSEQFYDHSRNRIWAFRELRVWNDHLIDGKHARGHHESDHGLICARFGYEPARG